MSARLGYSPELFNQTPIWALLWRCLVDVIKVHNQLSAEGRLPWIICVGLTQSVESSEEQSWGFPEEEEILPITAAMAHT